ncbi:VOC family protein [Streptomyces sp. NPDC032940]|uniref:VOC family protein n=1 Tax=Streptomyces sp. NPDC032940 TaxID=3155366 RepID=UPI00340D01D6
MLRLGLPVIGVTDVPRAVAFWTAALGLVARAERASGTWRTLEHADGSGALAVMRSESPVEPHPRVHLDLFTDTAEEQQAEVRRLIGLGAQAVDWDSYPADPDFVVLADPDGNRFCVIDLGHTPGDGDRPEL